MSTSVGMKFAQCLEVRVQTVLTLISETLNFWREHEQNIHSACADA